MRVRLRTRAHDQVGIRWWCPTREKVRSLPRLILREERNLLCLPLAPEGGSGIRPAIAKNASPFGLVVIRLHPHAHVQQRREGPAYGPTPLDDYVPAGGAGRHRAWSSAAVPSRRAVVDVVPSRKGRSTCAASSSFHPNIDPYHAMSSVWRTCASGRWSLNTSAVVVFPPRCARRHR